MNNLSDKITHTLKPPNKGNRSIKGNKLAPNLGHRTFWKFHLY